MILEFNQNILVKSDSGENISFLILFIFKRLYKSHRDNSDWICIFSCYDTLCTCIHVYSFFWKVWFHRDRLDKFPLYTT